MVGQHQVRLETSLLGLDPLVLKRLVEGRDPAIQNGLHFPVPTCPQRCRPVWHLSPEANSSLADRVCWAFSMTSSPCPWGHRQAYCSHLAQWTTWVLTVGQREKTKFIEWTYTKAALAFQPNRRRPFPWTFAIGSISGRGGAVGRVGI
jgi:hypothetical protein